MKRAKDFLGSEKNYSLDSKRAEMTSKKLVGLVIIILSVVVLLIFISLYFWKGRITKETCHNSIVLRSSANYNMVEASKTIIPLKCETEKICFTMSKGICEEFKTKEGKMEKDVRKIKLSKNKEEAKEKIKEVLTDEMYDWHGVLGEGILDFMPHKFRGKNYCLITTRFAFDDKAKETIGIISYGDIYQLLGERKTPQKKSYLEFIHPGWTNWEASENLFRQMKEDNPRNERLQNLKFKDWGINLKEWGEYVIIAQMTPKGTWAKWVTGGAALVGVVVGTALVATGFGAPVGVGLIVTSAKVGVVAGGIAVWRSHPSGKYNYAPPLIQPYDKDTLRSMNCNSFEFAP